MFVKQFISFRCYPKKKSLGSVYIIFLMNFGPLGFFFFPVYTYQWLLDFKLSFTSLTCELWMNIETFGTWKKNDLWNYIKLWTNLCYKYILPKSVIRCVSQSTKGRVPIVQMLPNKEGFGSVYIKGVLSLQCELVFYSNSSSVLQKTIIVFNLWKETLHKVEIVPLIHPYCTYQLYNAIQLRWIK